MVQNLVGDMGRDAETGHAADDGAADVVDAPIRNAAQFGC